MNQAPPQNSRRLGRELVGSNQVILGDQLITLANNLIHKTDLFAQGMPRGDGCPSLLGLGTFLTVLPQPLRVSTMEGEFQRPKGRDGTISVLNAAIEAEALNLAKEISSFTPAKTILAPSALSSR